MRIQLMIDCDSPPAEYPVQKTPIEDRIRDMLDLIESGHESRMEWAEINKLYKKLSDIPEDKRNERMNNVMQLIEPVLHKYGFHGVAADRTGY